MAARRTRLQQLATTAACIAVAGLSFAAPAGAATQLGEAFTPVDTCGGGGTTLQTVSPGPPYAAPTAGVITSWSHEAAGSQSPLKFKVARFAGGSNFTIVGESQFQTPTAGMLNTFPVRIPVQAGDVIGFYNAMNRLCSRTTSGFGFHTTGGDQPPGSTAAYALFMGSTQFDISATLEPDADADGFGDESQDACPIDASTQQPCPPETTITKGPKDKTKKKRANFEFNSPESGATFECSLDGGAFAPCTSPHEVKVKKGKHSLQVRATARGQTDDSPATDDWKVKKKKT